MLWNIVIIQVITQEEEEFTKFGIFNGSNGLKTMMCACCHFEKRISTYLIITYNPVDDFLFKNVLSEKYCLVTFRAPEALAFSGSWFGQEFEEQTLIYFSVWCLARCLQSVVSLEFGENSKDGTSIVGLSALLALSHMSQQLVK